MHLERSIDQGQMGNITIQFEGNDLSNTQRQLRKASPFFEMYRKVDRPTGAVWYVLVCDWLLVCVEVFVTCADCYIASRKYRSSVYRSDVVRSNLNPKWDEVTLSLEAACNGDMDRALKVVVWDHRRSGKHKLMGEFETNMERIHDAANTTGVNFFTLRRHDKDVGTITVVKADLVRPSAEETEQEKEDKPEAVRAMPAAPSGLPESISVPDRPEFLDYLTGGCQISLAVAIDFTASNGTMHVVVL